MKTTNPNYTQIQLCYRSSRVATLKLMQSKISDNAYKYTDDELWNIVSGDPDICDAIQEDLRVRYNASVSCNN